MYAILLMVSVPTGVFALGLFALVFLSFFLLSGIFGATPRYEISNNEGVPRNDSREFIDLLESLVDAKANRRGQLQVLTNGECFYETELAAIEEAQRSVNLEAYIFTKSEIGERYLESMTRKAREGAYVNVVLDGFGSAGVTRAFFQPLIQAGGKVKWYNRPAWNRLTHIDNRTHRELLVVDGKIGFIGGAGVADQWYTGAHGRPRWRDTMVRVEGDAVANLQATFAENWLSASGELMTGESYFPQISCAPETVALVINSTPTVGGSTRARILFQLLLASARRSIAITTPYFLPDNSLIQELCRAIKDRNVSVRVLVPGRKSDHLLTRSTSRAGYGALLEAGAEVYEYQPAMIHAKVLCVDGLWSVVGSTNFDNRSFGINDEVNLAVRDVGVAERLESDMTADLKESRRISLEDWRHRPVSERAPEVLGWIFERQQ
ncbi:MAG TPA: phospholipase D-like domain-containing protein [Edaphobacter sp.]